MVREVGRGRRLVTGLLVAGALATLTGCMAPAEAAPAPVPSPSDTPVEPYGDGVLTLATLLPRDGDRALAEMAGVAAAGRDAGAAATAGGTGIPPVRVLHRALPAGDGASIAAAVADVAARGADVLLARGDQATMDQVLAAASSARVLVVDLDSLAVRAEGRPDRALAAGPVPALTSLLGERGALVAVQDSAGEAVARIAPDLADERLLRPAVGGTASAGGLSWGDDVDTVVVAGQAASPATARTASALLSEGRDPASILVASDVPLSPEDSTRLRGVRGLVETTPTSLDELARVGAEDPAVVDPGQGIRAYRTAVAVLLGAVQAGDDGGLRIGQALPAVLTGASACVSVASCVDVLAHEGRAAYLPLTGAVGTYSASGWADALSPWSDVHVDNRR